jgi:hypothetical protein
VGSAHDAWAEREGVLGFGHLLTWRYQRETDAQLWPGTPADGTGW